MTELIQARIHKPQKSKKVFPSIEEIVKQRIEIGIAGSAESDLYWGGDLDESEYSDEAKEQLLAEVKQAEANKRQFGNLSSVLIKKSISYDGFAKGLIFASGRTSSPITTQEMIEVIEAQIAVFNDEKNHARKQSDQNRVLWIAAYINGLEYGLTKLKKALGKTK